MFIVRGLLIALSFFFAVNVANAQTPKSKKNFSDVNTAQVTVLFDAIGKPSKLKQGWGFSALVEYKGKRILFDTGGSEEIFSYNVRQLGVDLTNLDAVIVTHRHGDHTSGLSYVLSKNPTVKVYTPNDIAVFGVGEQGANGVDDIIRNMIKRKVDSTPSHLRYFGDNPPTHITPREGWPSAWKGANLETIHNKKQILPGFYLIQTTSATPGTMEMNEISLAIDTPKGLAILVGCSHPGIEKILTTIRAALPSSHFYTLIGGTHLVTKSDRDVKKTIIDFQNVWQFKRIAAGHCTGQLGFSELFKEYGENLDNAGVGIAIKLPKNIT